MVQGFRLASVSDDMRILSLLPAATEVLAALGALDEVVGVTHECDFPPGVTTKPTVLRPLINPGLSGGEIDSAVGRARASGGDLYSLDMQLLERLNPDLVITQGLCDVCAISGASVGEALAAVGTSPRVLTLHPHSLEEILQDVMRVGKVVDREAAAKGVLAQCHRRLEAIGERTRHLTHRPGVLPLEWLDPPYAAGHWVPEMVELAGGRCLVGRAGQASRRIHLEEALSARPEVVLVAACGYTVRRATEEMVHLDEAGAPQTALWSGGRVVVADGNAHFSRPGPRVVDGVEILAAALHPEVFPSPGPSPSTYLEYQGP